MWPAQPPRSQLPVEGVVTRARFATLIAGWVLWSCGALIFLLGLLVDWGMGGCGLDGGSSADAVPELQLWPPGIVCRYELDFTYSIGPDTGESVIHVDSPGSSAAGGALMLVSGPLIMLGRKEPRRQTQDDPSAV